MAKEKCNFKVGDTVRVVNNDDINYSGYGIGDTFKIGFIKSSPTVNYWLGTGSKDRGNGISEICCILANQHKVGTTIYKVTKHFNLIDIFNKKPCTEEYSKLMSERADEGYSIKHPLKIFRDVEESKVLMRNLDWLEKNWFISEKKEEYMWINIYIDEDEDGGYYIGSGYHSEKNALEQTKTKNPEYVGTIQLKPKSAQ